MINYDIKNIKEFMGIIFAGEVFDELYVMECEICMVTKISISGMYSKKWDEKYDKQYCNWKQIKGIVYNVIRGSKSPSMMKIVFSENDGEEFQSGIVTLKFQDSWATLTTGYFNKNFTLDKTDEKVWDKKIENILTNTGVDFKERFD